MADQKNYPPELIRHHARTRPGHPHAGVLNRVNVLSRPLRYRPVALRGDGP